MATRLSNPPGRNPVPAFTLIEVLVVVAIIALLISILLPSLSRAKEMSRRAVCASRLHNIGLGVTEYGMSNKGKIIQCRERRIPIAIDPRQETKETLGNEPDYKLVDWQAAAKKYKIDKVTWECPNREGLFAYEGRPMYNKQGYTKEILEGQGYQVITTEAGDEKEYGFQQWMLGYLYFGGMDEWRVQNFETNKKAPLPVDLNARGHWALAADANIYVQEKTYQGWGLPSRRSLTKIPPHGDRSGFPEGGNVLTMDAAVAWVPATKMWMMNDWHKNKSRKCFWWQQDIGDLAQWHKQKGWKQGIRAGLAQY